MQIRRLVLQDLGPFSSLDMSFPEGKIGDRADVHLLVGPNGSGKSSVLAAIAQCFAYGEAGFAGRSRSAQSFAAVDTTLGWRGVRLFDGSADELRFPQAEPLNVVHVSHDEQYIYNFNTNGFEAFDDAYWRAENGSTEVTRVPFAVFAYGGLRRAGPGRVDGIVELKDNALLEACTFTRPSGTGPLVQWLVNTEARRSLYLTYGQIGQAERRSSALNRLSSAMEEVIGAPVVFRLELEPFALKIGIGAAAPTPVDLLPDGLQSLLSWVGDLLMRLDRIPWDDEGPVTDRRFVLLLDEVEVHLHPGWQRRVIPMAERLFPNAQIIASTHSPFVIGSATDAWIHPFRLEGGHARVDPPLPSARGTSYPAIVDNILGITDEFDVTTEAQLKEYRQLWKARLGGDEAVAARLLALAAELAARSEELATIIGTEQRELRHRLSRGETSG